MKPLLFFLLALTTLSCGDDDSDQDASGQREFTFTDPTNSGGCGNFAMFYYSDDHTYGLQVQGDSAQLGITTDWQEYATNDAGLTVTLYQFSQPLTSFFCDDVIEANEDPVQEWEAEEGTVRLRIVREPNELELYTLDVELIDALINEIRLERIVWSEVEVGGRPG